MSGARTPRIRSAIRPLSRYFACIALMSATLPLAWQSMHCSPFKVIVEAAPIAGRAATEETVENFLTSVPPFDSMCCVARLLSWQPKQEEAIGELTRLSVL